MKIKTNGIEPTRHGKSDAPEGAYTLDMLAYDAHRRCGAMQRPLLGSARRAKLSSRPIEGESFPWAICQREWSPGTPPPSRA